MASEHEALQDYYRRVNAPEPLNQMPTSIGKRILRRVIEPFTWLNVIASVLWLSAWSFAPSLDLPLWTFTWRMAAFWLFIFLGADVYAEHKRLLEFRRKRQMR